MPGDSKPARKKNPWIVVGVTVLAVVVLFLLPQSMRDQMIQSLKAFILKIHSAPLHR